MAFKASKIALQRSGIKANELDMILFATLSPDLYFPGSGVSPEAAWNFNLSINGHSEYSVLDSSIQLPLLINSLNLECTKIYWSLVPKITQED